MTKQEVKASLAKHGKEFLSLGEVAEILGIDRGTARQWMSGVSYLPCGRRKLYHINDIAERLMQLREN